MEKIQADFSCICSICVFKKRNEPKAPKHYPERSFIWLLENLGKASISNKIHMNIPETAVFSKGKPLFEIYKKDKTIGLLNTNLNVADIIKSFTNAARNRKRGLEENSKEAVLIRYTKNSQGEEPFRIFTENEFTELLWERPGSKVWVNILYLQTLLKAKGGVGEPFLFNYTSKAKYNLKYNILHRVHPGRALKSKNLCKEYCKKLSYFVGIVSGYEIMHMEVEFLKDFDGTLWIVYVQNIGVKEIKDFIFEKSSDDARKPGKLNLKPVVCPNSPIFKRMTEKIENHFKKIGVYYHEPLDTSARNPTRKAKTPLKSASRPKFNKVKSFLALAKSRTPLAKVQDWKYTPRINSKFKTRKQNLNSFFRKIQYKE